MQGCLGVFNPKHGTQNTMRNKIVQYLVLLPVLGLAGLAGCASGPEGSTPDIRQEVAWWADLGGTAALIENPKNEVAIRAAVAYLDAAEANGGTFTVSTLREVLARFRELQSKDSKLAILGGTAVLRRYAGSIDLQSPDLLRAAGLGLRDGLKAALGPE